LGYAYGLQWLMLPLSWLLGDAIFWWLFPQRINALGLKTRATTLSDLLVADLPKKQNRILRRLIGLVIVLCLAGYVSAQWIAGEKFLAGAFDFSGFVALA